MLAGIPLWMCGQQTIVEVEYVGLRRVQPRFLDRFVESKTGMEFDSTVFLDDVRRLHNLQLFAVIQVGLSTFALSQKASIPLPVNMVQGHLASSMLDCLI